MELYIVTGASRGLGRALAQQLLQPQRLLLTIARRPDHTLEAIAAMKGAKIEQWALDLAHGVGAAARLHAWLHAQPGERFARATLINNAGLLGHVGPLDAADAEVLATTLRVDLEAPLLLTSAFLRATRRWSAERRVLNVSSGAGRRPIAGWAAYCAAKAGLDHFARVVALDEQRLPNPARIVSLAPGIIDTDMQAELRAADPAGFPDLEQFRAFKAQGQLATPEAAAQRLLAYLARTDFGSQPVADVRDL
ncbi:MAG: SDR family NAD(P)-dependent oxidoreductase [Sutterellaceae bacterium]|nr:SDR family NAD(P)-dependent oxidoreductase [Burkholderiaceae bacterium]MDW8429881.1 SDR family NAD(P)-dependent oxidoreductase [Sutterellaceae bacterium]